MLAAAEHARRSDGTQRMVYVGQLQSHEATHGTRCMWQAKPDPCCRSFESAKFGPRLGAVASGAVTEETAL